jgi:lipopolysaccharide export LptBFGC system permease protein LptF
MRELKGEIARHPLVENAHLFRKQTRPAISNKRSEMAEQEKHIRNLRGKIEQHVETEPRRQDQIIARDSGRRDDMQRRIEELLRREKDVVRDLQQAMAAQPPDHDEADRLRKERQTIDDEVENARKQVQEAEQNIAEARRRKDAALAKAAQLRAELDVLLEAHRKLAAETNELVEVTRQADRQHALRGMRIRLHKRLAQAVSVMVFVLVGIPLGVMTGGRSVMVAFGISFAIVLLIFYPLLVAGQVLAETAVLPVPVAMWAGNAITALIGLTLMQRMLHR